MYYDCNVELVMPYLTGGGGVVPSHSFGSIKLIDTNTGHSLLG